MITGHMNYLGIDIGGTSIKGVLLNGLEKQEVKLHSVPTPADRDAMRHAIVALADGLREGNSLAGIGIGVPGMADRATGMIQKAPNVPYLNGWHIADVFDGFGAPVAIENDSRCFVLAEFRWGAARGYKNVIGLAIGTGIGGGIMIDDKLYVGSHNAAGEFGHTVIGIRNQELGIMGETFEGLAAKEAFEKYGDRSEIIGIGAANLINAFDPDIVVLGGGGMTSGQIKLPVVQEAVRRFAISPQAKKTPVVAASLGEAAQAIGAALLFQKSSSS